jgi:phosphate transport system permease protein
VRFRHLGDRLLAALGLLVMLLALAALGALIYDVLHDGAGRLSWQFLTSLPSRRARDAGILSALVGSI